MLATANASQWNRQAMKMTLCAILIGTTCVLSFLHKRASGCFPVSPRDSSGVLRTAVDLNTETVLIVWDAEHKTEHFVRKATFETSASHLGLLVPTPTKPDLTEVKDVIFAKLFSITAPPPRPNPLGVSFGGVENSVRARVPVTVLETKEVAGFEAAVLAATDPMALAEWLRQHNYQSSSELDAWLRPYIERAWIITAFKIAKSKPEVRAVVSAAVRMSFQTDRPFFPYREAREGLVAEEVIARQPAEAQKIIRTLLARDTEHQRQLDAQDRRRSRALRIYFLADSAFNGHLGEVAHLGHWKGMTVYSKQLRDQDRELLEVMGITSFHPRAKLWLTEFLDTSVRREVDRDLFFSAVMNPSALDPPVRLPQWKQYRGLGSAGVPHLPASR